MSTRTLMLKFALKFTLKFAKAGAVLSLADERRLRPACTATNSRVSRGMAI